MVNVIAEELEKSGMTVMELAKRSGVPYSTTHEIVSGKRKTENVAIQTFIKLAHGLGTTADALLEQTAQEPHDQLSPDERELLVLFRSCNEEGMAAILASARGIAALFPLERDKAEEVARGA